MANTEREELQKKLKEFFKFESFKSDDQYHATLAVMSTENSDVLINLPPATGKSICYQLPTMLCHRQITIIIVPNKYIAEEQMKFLAEHNIESFYVFSKTNQFNLSELFEDFVKTIKFIYVIPQMLMNTWLQSLMHMLNAHNLISFIVIDEAHYISEHYQISRKLYKKIGQVRNAYGNTKFVALTSIGTENIMTDIKHYLQLKNLREISHLNWKLPYVYLQVKYKDLVENPFVDIKQLIENFIKVSKDFSGIICCSKCEETIMVAKQLTQLGIPTGAYCSILNKKQKKENEKNWMTGKTMMLAVTHELGMKFNKPSIQCIIYWSSPLRIEQYYRQMGNHSRNNIAILCRVYFGIEDWINMQIVAMGAPNRTFEGSGSMIQYCLSTECRHLMYSRYLGININPCDDACDFCDEELNVITRQKKFREFVEQRGMLSKFKQIPFLRIYNLNKTERIVKDLEPIDRYDVYEILHKVLLENHKRSSCLNKPDIETKYLSHLARGLEYSIFSTSNEGPNYKYRMINLIQKIKKATTSKEVSNYILNYKCQVA